MASLMKMAHAGDPRADLKAKVGDLPGFKVFHNNILVAMYVRPEKTGGGIILTDATRKEDVYQGKVGLVLAKGPLAFQDSPGYEFKGCDAQVGDWVVFRNSDGWALEANGAPCRMMEDTHIKGVVASPDDVY